MSTRLMRFRDHARAMSTADHKLDCPHLTTKKPYWPRWAAIDNDGNWCANSGRPMTGLGWLGPEPPWEPPPCDGCVTDADRAEWSRLATEADAYLDRNREETLL